MLQKLQTKIPRQSQLTSQHLWQKVIPISMCRDRLSTLHLHVQNWKRCWIGETSAMFLSCWLLRGLLFTETPFSENPGDLIRKLLKLLFGRTPSWMARACSGCLGQVVIRSGGVKACIINLFEQAADTSNFCSVFPLKTCCLLAIRDLSSPFPIWPIWQRWKHTEARCVPTYNQSAGSLPLFHASRGWFHFEGCLC